MPIFSDAFTVASDTELHAYNAAYTQIAFPSSVVMTVLGAQDYPHPSAEASDCYYRATPSGFPTGNQNIQTDIQPVKGGGSGSHYLFARVTDATAAAKMYALEINEEGASVRFLYIDSDSFTQLKVSTTAVPVGVHTYKFEAVGTGATVTLKWYLDGVLTDSYVDSSATVIDSGAPGFGYWIFDGGDGTYHHDNLVIDTPAGGSTTNLSEAGSTTPTGALHNKAQHKLAGSISPSGAVSSVEVPGSQSISLAGSITPSGILSVAAGINSMIGSSSPSGTVSFSIIGGLLRDTFNGSIAPHGAVHLLAKHKVAGSITPSGALVTHTPSHLTTAVAGSITPTGDVRNVQLPPAHGGGYGWVHHRWHRR